jgi:hypothetical protein
MKSDPETIELAAQAIFEFMRNTTMNMVLGVEEYGQLKPWDSLSQDDKELYRARARSFEEVLSLQGDTAILLHDMMGHFRTRAVDWNSRKEKDKLFYEEAAIKIEKIFEKENVK